MSLSFSASIWSTPARWASLAVLLGLLGACSNLPLPEKPVRPTVYDFGPGPVVTHAVPAGVAITLPEVDAPRALAQLPVMYRLAYEQSQTPMPYAQAAWSMPPAQLLHQRLRTLLGEQHPVLRVGDGLAQLELRIQLEEFSQIFTTPEQSHGLLRLRVTALSPHAGNGQRLLQQRMFELKAPAPTPNAAGGVHALTHASDEAARQIGQWIQTLPIQPAAHPAAKPATATRSP